MIFGKHTRLYDSHLPKWETVSGRFAAFLIDAPSSCCQTHHIGNSRESIITLTRTRPRPMYGSRKRRGLRRFLEFYFFLYVGCVRTRADSRSLRCNCLIVQYNFLL
jgi:hypothetical protein